MRMGSRYGIKLKKSRNDPGRRLVESRDERLSDVGDANPESSLT